MQAKVSKQSDESSIQSDILNVIKSAESETTRHKDILKFKSFFRSDEHDRGPRGGMLILLVVIHSTFLKKHFSNVKGEATILL